MNSEALDRILIGVGKKGEEEEEATDGVVIGGGCGCCASISSWQWSWSTPLPPSSSSIFSLLPLLKGDDNFKNGAKPEARVMIEWFVWTGHLLTHNFFFRSNFRSISPRTRGLDNAVSCCTLGAAVTAPLGRRLPAILSAPPLSKRVGGVFSFGDKKMNQIVCVKLNVFRGSARTTHSQRNLNSVTFIEDTLYYSTY